MLGHSKSPNYKLDMSIAKEVFETFNNDLNFLHKVKPPSWLDPKLGLLYFKSAAGKEYLRKKYQEFNFKIEEKEKPVDLGVKSGDDVLEHKARTIREFLNE